MLIALIASANTYSILHWPALILGAMSIFNGVRSIRHRQTDAPERYAGDHFVRLGWPWIPRVCGVLFEITPLTNLFRRLPEAGARQA